MDAQLYSKIVGDIKGEFFIPSYQRGYRWGKNEVTRLLDDIFQNKNEKYCLQPIVVRKDNDVYRVVDGQQRLTTIYLILKYMNLASIGFIPEPRFNLSYETRPGSQTFLESSFEDMTNQKNENVDYWFIANSYQTIKEWFEKSNDKSIIKQTISKFSELFDTSVNVIWYEIGPEEDERKLFTRLNTDKIPLTSAELTKAMFLSKTNANNITRTEQEEIALQWDSIEKDLSNESLWFFLTNSANSAYRTRIDLVLDMMSGKESSDEPYFTFFYFDKRQKTESLKSIWQDIYHTFSLFKDWHENHDLYHKIGYLISSDSDSLKTIFNYSQRRTKTAFLQLLDDKIRNSIEDAWELEDLTYEDDYLLIKKIMLLFNVESVCNEDEQTQWFPFDKYKQQNWSLEHIHAQHANMSQQKEWIEWLRIHLDSLNDIVSPDKKDEDYYSLINEIETIIQSNKIEDRQKFEELHDKAIALLSDDTGEDYIHTISNLALLNTSDNSALNNAAFDVKRNRIIELDRHGKFIPFCTKMVFLKYYSPSSETQIHFWGDYDRRNYVKRIKEALAKYLPESEN